MEVTRGRSTTKTNTSRSWWPPSNLPLYPVISCKKKIHKVKILSKNHENKTDGLVMSECQVPKAWAAALPYPWPWKKVDTKEPQHLDKLPLLPFLWPAVGKILHPGWQQGAHRSQEHPFLYLAGIAELEAVITHAQCQSYFDKYNAWWNKCISSF